MITADKLELITVCLENGYASNSVNSRESKMLRHLTRAKRQGELLKQYSAAQYVNSFRKKSSGEKKDNESDKSDKELPDSTILNRTGHMFKTLKNDLKSFKQLLSERDFSNLNNIWEHNIIPAECDVLIVGGGAIGSSIAYWLRQKFYKEEFKVVVVEKDPSYAKASTTLSVGGLRQQFSLEENIQMSVYGAEFIRNINNHLSIPGKPFIDLGFHPYGYLVLTSEAGAETLMQNSKLQNSLGAKNIIMTTEKLKRTFPWLNTDGIAAGCLGLEKEGWFDPWTLLCAFKNKATYLGARYINAEVTAFQYKDLPGMYDERMNPNKRLTNAVVQTNDGEIRKIQFSIVIIAAGAFSGSVAEMADIGTGKGILAIPLPVEPRKRYVYCIHSPDGPGLNTPLTIDTTGTYFRREGLAGNYICGRTPEIHEEPSVDNLDVDHEFFDNKVWPALANRVPAFENLKVKSSWAGYYEYNTFDENGIIGKHPHHSNLYIATGFSGHGIQKAPAVGRAIAELILHNRFMSIDLSKLSFKRFMTSEPMREANIF